jgi:hypothetical protein
VQGQDLEAAVALIDREQAERFATLLGDEPLVSEGIDELAETRHEMDATAVLGQKVPGPVVIVLDEVSNPQLHWGDQLPRYVLIPNGLRSSGT